MEVGSVDFRVNLDLSELDKQLKVASKQIQSALNDVNLNVNINVPKPHSQSGGNSDASQQELRRINSNIIAYGKQQSKLLNDIKRVLEVQSKSSASVYITKSIESGFKQLRQSQSANTKRQTSQQNQQAQKIQQTKVNQAKSKSPNLLSTAAIFGVIEPFTNQIGEGVKSGFEKMFGDIIGDLDLAAESFFVKTAGELGKFITESASELSEISTEKFKQGFKKLPANLQQSLKTEGIYDEILKALGNLKITPEVEKKVSQQLRQSLGISSQSATQRSQASKISKAREQAGEAKESAKVGAVITNEQLKRLNLPTATSSKTETLKAIESASNRVDEIMTDLIEKGLSVDELELEAIANKYQEALSFKAIYPRIQSALDDIERAKAATIEAETLQSSINGPITPKQSSAIKAKAETEATNRRKNLFASAPGGGKFQSIEDASKAQSDLEASQDQKTQIAVLTTQGDKLLQQLLQQQQTSIIEAQKYSEFLRQTIEQNIFPTENQGLLDSLGNNLAKIETLRESLDAEDFSFESIFLIKGIFEQIAQVDKDILSDFNKAQSLVQKFQQKVLQSTQQESFKNLEFAERQHIKSAQVQEAERKKFVRLPNLYLQQIEETNQRLFGTKLEAKNIPELVEHPGGSEGEYFGNINAIALKPEWFKLLASNAQITSENLEEFQKALEAVTHEYIHALQNNFGLGHNKNFIESQMKEIQQKLGNVNPELMEQIDSYNLERMGSPAIEGSVKVNYNKRSEKLARAMETQAYQGQFQMGVPVAEDILKNSLTRNIQEKFGANPNIKQELFQLTKNEDLIKQTKESVKLFAGTPQGDILKKLEKEVTDQFLQGIADIGKVLQPQLSSLNNLSLDALANIDKSVVQRVDEWIQFQKLFIQKIQQVAESEGEIDITGIENFAKVLKKFGTKTVSDFEVFTEKNVEVLSSASKNLSPEQKEINNRIQDFAAEIKELKVENLYAESLGIEKIADSVDLENVAKELKKLSNNQLLEIGKQLEVNSPETKSIDNKNNQVDRLLASGNENFLNAAIAQVNNATEKLIDSYSKETISTAFSSLQTEMLQSLEDAKIFSDASIIEQPFENIENFQAELRAASQEVDEDLRKVINGYLGQLGKLLKQGERVGVEIIQGLNQGIETGDLEQSGNNIGESIIKGTEDSLEIKSPSRWAKRIGIFITKGLEKGLNLPGAIADQFKALNENAETEIEDLAETFSEGFDLNLFENADNTVDLSGIRKDFEQIIENIKELNSELGTNIDFSRYEEALEALPETYNPAVEDAAESTESWGEMLRDAQGSLEGIITAGIGFGALIFVYQKFGDTLRSFAEESFQAAVEFEKIGTTSSFVLGSVSKAIAKIEELRESARDLGIDQIAVMESYNSLAASTRNTPLEGRNTDLMAESLNQAAAAFSLSAEQIEGAYTAIQQIAGKGVVSAEELRGQLAERIPGAFQIAARAMKVTEQELFQLMSQGALSATDFLPAMAKQLKIETFAGVEAATQTTAFQLQKVQNYLKDIQITLGGKLLPLAKTGLKIVNTGLQFVSENLETILAIVSTGLGFAATHFLQAIAPILKGVVAKALSSIITKIIQLTVGVISFSKALLLAKGALAAINNSGFLKLLVVIEGVKIAYQSMRTIFGAFDITDNPMFAEQTVWDDLAKKVKKTTKSIRDDIDSLDKSLDKVSDLSRELKPEGLTENVAYSLVNANPLIEDREKRRAEALEASNQGKTGFNLFGLKFQPHDRQGRIASYASMREDDYLTDMEKRMREIDKELKVGEIINSIGLAKQNAGKLAELKTIDNTIATLTAQKSLLKPTEVGRKDMLSKQIEQLQEEREKLSVDFTAFHAGYSELLKIINAELEIVTDPQAIAQLEVQRAGVKKTLDLLKAWEAENGPINVAKKFALALQELNFAFEAIAQNADKANTAIQRNFTQQKLSQFSTNYFADIELAFKESTFKLKIIEAEAQESQAALARISANLENNPKYREALAKIKQEEEKLGRDLVPADLEYFKEKYSSSQDTDLINAIDAEIKLRNQTLELDKKLLEKDEMLLDIQQQREQVALAKLDLAKRNADIQQQLAEAGNRGTLADMGMQGDRSTDIAAVQAIFQEESVGQRIGNLKIDKSALQEAFKQGEVSAKEYQDRLQETNLELANLNAELKEAKLQTQQALDARFLEHIERQIAGVNHQISLNQINREAHNLIAYQESLSHLNSAQVELANATRNSETQIANLTEQLNASKQALDALMSSGSNSEEIAAKITETKRQIETQSAELVRAQIQANQEITKAQQQAALDDIDRSHQNAEHQASIAELSREYQLLNSQFKSLKADTPLATFEQATEAAKSKVEALNHQLKNNQELIKNLQNSGVNTPEIRDRIQQVGRQVETQEKQLAIARKQSEIDIFSARKQMLDDVAAKEKEITEQRAREFLENIDRQKEETEHQTAVSDLNKEYKNLQKQFKNLGKHSPLANFEIAIDEAKSKVESLAKELENSQALMEELQKAPVHTEEIRDRIKQTTRQIELQKLQLKIAKEQAKIDISNAHAEKISATLENKRQELEQAQKMSEIILKTQNNLEQEAFDVASLGGKMTGIKEEMQLVKDAQISLHNAFTSGAIAQGTYEEKIEDLKIEYAGLNLELIELTRSSQAFLSPLEKLSREIENQTKLLDNQTALLDSAKAKYDAISGAVSSLHGQMLETTSSIKSQFEQLGIFSEELLGVQSQMKLNKSRLDLRNLKRQLRFEEKSLNLQRERSLLEREKTGAEAAEKIYQAQEVLHIAQESREEAAIKVAQEKLKIAKKEEQILRKQQRTEDIIYSRQREILAIRSESEIKIQRVAQTTLAYENSLERLSMTVKKINQEFDRQKNYLQSYKDLMGARAGFTEQMGGARLQQLNFGANIARQLQNPEISGQLRHELESQASALGISGYSEIDIMLKAFDAENKLAEERLETLKQQQEIERSLLEMDLRRAELDAQQAVVQAQILSAWSQMMGGGDTMDLVNEAIANLDFTRQQGNFARQAQEIGQATDVNRFLSEDWLRQLGQRQEIAGTEGYAGGLGSLPQKPQLLEPNLKMPSIETSDRYQPMQIEGEQFVPKFANLGAGIGESNKLLKEIRDLLRLQEETGGNVDLTVVSSNAVADAGKILNDISKPF